MSTKVGAKFNNYVNRLNEEAFYFYMRKKHIFQLTYHSIALNTLLKRDHYNNFKSYILSFNDNWYFSN